MGGQRGGITVFRWYEWKGKNGSLRRGRSIQKETWGGGNKNTKDVWFIVSRYSRHYLKKNWCWDHFLALSKREWGYFYRRLYKIFTSYTSDTERLLPRTCNELKRNKTTQTINRSMNWAKRDQNCSLSTLWIINPSKYGSSLPPLTHTCTQIKLKLAYICILLPKM